MGGSQLIPITEQQRYFPYQGGFRYVRNDFWGAGLDNFTTPPSQNQEVFSTLTNVMPTLDGCLRGRWGYTQFCDTGITDTNLGTNLYSYQNDTTGLRYIVACSPSKLTARTEAGAAYRSSIFTPTGLCRMISSRSTAFFSSGFPADLKQWNGSITGGVYNWGIGVGNTTVAVAAGAICGTGTNSSADGGTIVWANPGNITATDATYATATLTPTDSWTQNLFATNFGFSIPSDQIITGLTVKLIGHIDTTDLLNFAGVLSPIINGVWNPGYGKQVNGTQFTSVDTALTFGSSADTWGIPLTPAIVNSSNFGISFLGIGQANAATTCDISIDSVTVTISYGGAFTVTPGGALSGAINLTYGRTYCLAYQNSATGDVSDITNFTVSTGPLTSQDVALSAIPVSADSQVDTKLILATLDGNDTETLYLVGTIPNATTTFTDNITDTQLAVSPVYLETGTDGLIHGCVGNDPPPANAALPIIYNGRVFMAQGSILWFTKNLNELTTSTGTVCGRPETSWPGNYQMDATKEAETIRALFTDGNALYIGTEKHIRKITGDYPNFSQPNIIFNDVGVMNMNCMQTVYKEEQPIGVAFITPDHRALLTDFNTYQNIGLPIQTTLNTINDTVAATMVNSQFHTSSGYDMLFMAIPTGANTECDTVCVLDLKLNQWRLWTPHVPFDAQLFNISASQPNQPQILFIKSGVVYQFGSSYASDYGSVAIPVTVQTTWLHFGDPTILKLLNELVLLTDYTGSITVKIEGANLEADFTTPIVIQAATTLAQGFLGDWKLAGLAGLTTKYRFYRFTFAVPSLVAGSKLLQGFNIETIPFARL